MVDTIGNNFKQMQVRFWKGKVIQMITEKEKWEYISKLSEIRSEYSCFEDDEEPYYRALSEGIKALKSQITTETR